MLIVTNVKTYDSGVLVIVGEPAAIVTIGGVAFKQPTREASLFTTAKGIDLKIGDELPGYKFGAKIPDTKFHTLVEAGE